MKTINTCSNCLRRHTWKEIDYDNILYISVKNAICLTLCQSCATRFLDTQQNKPSIVNEYKQKADNILLGNRGQMAVSNKPIFNWFW
jgi:hypothetical protein